MLRRLMFLAAASIAACIASSLAVRFFLADVIPTRWSEEPAPFWRLESAVLLLTLQWMTGVVGLLAALAVVVLQFRRRWTWQR